MTRPVGRRVYLTLVVSLLGPVTAAAQTLVTAPGPGNPSTVRVIDASGTDQSFLGYDPAFLDGVRVALGDANGDGMPGYQSGAPRYTLVKIDREGPNPMNVQSARRRN